MDKRTDQAGGSKSLMGPHQTENQWKLWWKATAKNVMSKYIIKGFCRLRTLWAQQTEHNRVTQIADGHQLWIIAIAIKYVRLCLHIKMAWSVIRREKEHQLKEHCHEWLIIQLPDRLVCRLLIRRVNWPRIANERRNDKCFTCYDCLIDHVQWHRFGGWGQSQTYTLRLTLGLGVPISSVGVSQYQHIKITGGAHTENYWAMPNVTRPSSSAGVWLIWLWYRVMALQYKSNGCLLLSHHILLP